MRTSMNIHDLVISKKQVLHSVRYQVMNSDRLNELPSLPHKCFLDLIVVYRAPVVENEEGMCALLVTDAVMEDLHITLEELDEAAKINTVNVGFEIDTLVNSIAKLTGVPLSSTSKIPPLYVLSNRDKTYGASIILYTKFFDILAAQFDSNLFILPSSTHELIVVPDFAVPSADSLKEMVDDVNDKFVPEKDFLSSNVYLFNHETSQFSIV